MSKKSLRELAFERRIHNREKKTDILSIHAGKSTAPIDIASFKKNHLLLISCNPTLTEHRRLEKLKKRLPKFCRIQIHYKIGKKIKKVTL